jgi:hypothetical protein
MVLGRAAGRRGDCAAEARTSTSLLTDRPCSWPPITAWTLVLLCRYSNDPRLFTFVLSLNYEPYVCLLHTQLDVDHPFASQGGAYAATVQGAAQYTNARTALVYFERGKNGTCHYPLRTQGVAHSNLSLAPNRRDPSLSLLGLDLDPCQLSHLFMLQPADTRWRERSCCSTVCAVLRATWFRAYATSVCSQGTALLRRGHGRRYELPCGRHDRHL